MSLDHTLLGFLSMDAMTGYDLKRHMDESTQFFWHASLSQIYPALKKMEKTGLIISNVEPQDGKPDKKIYAITEAGRAELMQWLAAPLTVLPPTKDVILLKVFFSGFLDKEVILRHLHTQLDLHHLRLVRYQQQTQSYIQHILADSSLAREGIMWELVRQYGEEKERTYVRWLENAIETVEEKL